MATSFWWPFSELLNNPMKTHLILVFALIFCAACGTEDTKHIDNESGISLEVLDSIQINFLGNPLIQDVSPAAQTVLFLNDIGNYSQTIYLANFEGEIIHSYSKFGDMPDVYGTLLCTIKILNEDKFLALGSYGFSTYDFSGNLVSRVKLKNYQVPDRVFGMMGYGMEKYGDRYLLYNQEFPPNKDYSDKDFVEDLFLLKWLVPETGEALPFLKFPEKSLFRNGKYFFRNAWDPAYHLADELIYVAFGVEPVIYGFELKAPHELVTTIPLEIEEFRNFKGGDAFTDEIGSFEGRFQSAFIENIKKIDGHFIIGYFPGYDDGDLVEARENKSVEEKRIFLEKMKKKHPRRIAVADSTGKILHDFVPGRLDPRSMILRDGQIWMRELPDEEMEQDYFRLFRVELKVGE
jgi:hypothetical protein